MLARRSDPSRSARRIPAMRSVVVLLALTAVAAASAAPGSRVLVAHGVRLTVPPGWGAVRPAGDGTVVDPRTLLVAGTAGVAPRTSACQIAAYRVQPRGAAVVVVGWRTATSAGGRPAPGRAPLTALRTVTRPSFECFAGRGASAQVALRGTVYQVNVLVGDRASRRVVAEALAVGRSFALAR
jgi:hypothetical protein